MKFEKKSKQRYVPGTIVYTGISELETKFRHIKYNQTEFSIEDKVTDIDQTLNNLISVEGFKNQSDIIDLSKKLEVDPFFIEDIFNVAQRNKFTSNEDQAFVIIKYAALEENKIIFKYLSIVVKKKTIVIYSDYENSYLSTLLERVENKIALFPKFEVGFLLYSIYDMIIDDQLELTKKYKTMLNELESDVLEFDNKLGPRLYMVHKNLVVLRNNARALHENVLPEHLFGSDILTIPSDYIQDLQDHIYNLLEKLNNNIEVCNTLVGMHSNNISNRTNEVMKMLTIISVIFIPLSFLAGVFGMNFTVFPILDATLGIPLFIGFSVLMVVGMIVFFKIKKWI